jgi:hypothetical protein
MGSKREENGMSDRAHLDTFLTAIECRLSPLRHNAGAGPTRPGRQDQDVLSRVCHRQYRVVRCDASSA